MWGRRSRDARPASILHTTSQRLNQFDEESQVGKVACPRSRRMERRSVNAKRAGASRPSLPLIFFGLQLLLSTSDPLLLFPTSPLLLLLSFAPLPLPLRSSVLLPNFDSASCSIGCLQETSRRQQYERSPEPGLRESAHESVVFSPFSSVTLRAIRLASARLCARDHQSSSGVVVLRRGRLRSIRLGCAFSSYLVVGLSSFTTISYRLIGPPASNQFDANNPHR